MTAKKPVAQKAPPSVAKRRTSRASGTPPKAAKSATSRKRSAGRPVKDDAQDAREHILNIAIDLFASQGLHVPSIRDITQAANVNVALIRYYFESKQGLLEAVVRKAASPIIAERHRLLDECVIKSKPGDKDYVYQAIAAYVRPVLSTHAEPIANEVAVRRIVGLAWADPDPAVRLLMDSLFNGAARRLVTILKQACPHLSDEEFNWRAACLFSVIYTLYTEPGRMKNMVGAEVNLKNKERALTYVIPFLVAGMTQS